MKISKSSSVFFIIFILNPILLAPQSSGKAFKPKPKPGYDFFFLVQQWPGGYCDTKRGCCYPTTGKPAEDFSIHGLWPNFNDGSYPSSCDPKNPFNKSLISDLMERMQTDWPTLSCPSKDGIKFWSHEWKKHGTCSEDVLDMHSFFEKTLDLKNSSNLLQHLKDAGINPDDGFYSAVNVEEAIKSALGVTPYLECNSDTEGNNQLSQVYLCVDKPASEFIECPVMPHAKRCDSEFQFQSFSGSNSSITDL